MAITMSIKIHIPENRSKSDGMQNANGGKKDEASEKGWNITENYKLVRKK